MLDFIIPSCGTIPAVTINLNVNLNVSIRHVRNIKKPGPITITAIGEEMNQIRMNVNSAADPDVVTREVTVSVEGAEPLVLTYPISEPASFVVGQDVAFTLSVVDIDDGDNRSPATTGSFVAKDTFAPGAPGELSVTAIGEE